MIEPFRHNSWATTRLLEFCRDLDPALLDTGASGAYGPIKETLAHIVGWEEVLHGAVEGTGALDVPPRFASVSDLLERSARLTDRWERSLDPEPHPERIIEFGIRGGGRRLVRVGTVLAQVVHHGNHHRSQVCTALSSVDIDPPALDAWAYAAWHAENGSRGARRRDDL